MKKGTNKPTKLSKFEKRVEERHRRQEAEYGRDEFLFGAAEDDEEADVEFDEDIAPSRRSEKYRSDEAESGYDDEYDYADADESEVDYADADDAEDIDGDVAEAEPAPRVGEHTEMIAAEIVEAEMASLAAEMSADDYGDVESGTTGGAPAEPASVPVGPAPSDPASTVSAPVEPAAVPDDAEGSGVGYETMNISAAILAETEREIAEASAFEDEDEPDGEDEDFDFYSMSETAEIEAAAVAREMYHRPERERASKPKVHKDSAAHKSADHRKASDRSRKSDDSGSVREMKAEAKSARASEKHAKSTAKSAKASAKYAKSAAKSARSEARYEKSAAKYERSAAKYERSSASSGKSSRSGSRKVRDRRRRGGFFGGIADFFSNMTMGDRLIAVTGVCVLITAIVTGVIFANTQTIRKQVASFDTVGASTDGIYIVGENGLNAVVAARAGYSAVQEEPEEIIEEEEPEEIVIEEKGVTIVMKVSSVQSDLKIKFANKATDKLISGIPFEVTVTSDSGKEYNWTDENKDGLMYHTEVPNGTYNVSMKPLEGPEYEDYVMPADVNGVKVTDTIAYKKIDVADEVKTEAEVNVAQEDTAVQDTAIESSLKDTVEWVESTKTLISGSETGYTEISKDSVTSPYSSSRLVIRNGDQRLRAVSSTWLMPYMGAGLDNGGGDGDNPPPTNENGNSGETGDNSGNTENTGNTGGNNTGDNSGNNGADTGGNNTGDNNGNSTGDNNGGSGENNNNNNTGGNTSENGGGNSENNESGQGQNQNPPEEPKIVINSSSSVSLDAGKEITASATASGSTSVIKWKSSDSSIATVDENTGKITAVKAGTVTITAYLSDNSNVTGAISVTVNAVKDTTTQQNTTKPDPKAELKDKSGRQVYVLENNSYRKATNGDYDGFSVFYIQDTSGQAVYKYTGWQTIDGSTFFYDKDGNYVTGEQVIQGAKYTFSSDGHLQAGSGTMGIDVSKWNGNIDWTAVRNSGVSYVIIRCGYRGSTTGALIEDPKFRANIKGAKAAGIAVGAYFFTQAVNEVEAVEEASMAIGLCSGYGLSLPIFLDVEHSGGRGDSINAATRTAVCKAFCNTVRNSGYGAGIYANKTWLTSYMNASQLTGYKIWLAQYAATPTYTATRYDYWQYTSKGSVAGISGNVDMNIRY